MTAKEEYTQKINEMLTKCSDIAMLDLIYRLLKKSQQA